jgi:ADP-ribosyl-[dinitrogen reductase] hydrolase
MSGLSLEERALGTILGAAIGDALGAPLEFLTPRSPENFVKDMIGGGTLRWKPGETTDDTQMAKSIMEMYLEKGEYHQPTIINKWVDWRNTNPKDIGLWTEKVLRKWYFFNRSDQATDRPLHGSDNPAHQVWKAEGMYSAGNGSVMRCMPSAVWWHDDENAMLFDTIRLSEDTHPHPKCTVGCLLVNEMLWEMMNGKDREEAYRDTLQNFSQYPTTIEIVQAFQEAPNHPWDQWENKGYVVDTVKCATAALMQSKTFEDGLVHVVNRGNDADSVGAVAGALLGAHFGVGAIPMRWLDKLHGREFLVGFVQSALRR